MKTSILKWDTRIQFLLLLFALIPLFIPACWFLALPLAFYQLVSNILELELNHKSLGFQHKRKSHLVLELFVLLIILSYLIFHSLLSVSAKSLSRLILSATIELLLITYFKLCRSELSFIRHRELSILK